MLLNYSDIYLFYHEKCFAINAVILGVLLALFVLTSIIGQRSAVSKFIWHITAFISLFILIYVTVISREIGATGDDALKYFFPIDFYSEKKRVEIMGNIIMFIPFGVSSRMIIKSRHPFLMVCLTGIIVSLMLECVQYLLHCGYMELIDLLTNEAGMLIGCLAASCFSVSSKPD